MDQVLNRGYELKYAIIRAVMNAILAISYRSLKNSGLQWGLKP